MCQVSSESDNSFLRYGIPDLLLLRPHGSDPYSRLCSPASAHIALPRSPRFYVHIVAALMEAIKRDFGSLETLKDTLSGVTVGVQGSGWGWLGFDKCTKKLSVTSCPNQDPLEPTKGLYLFTASSRIVMFRSC